MSTTQNKIMTEEYSGFRSIMANISIHHLIYFHGGNCQPAQPQLHISTLSEFTPV